ncbi:MAG: hypothetical protein F9K47_19295, partial [Burkholderiales bacterium]
MLLATFAGCRARADTVSNRMGVPGQALCKFTPPPAPIALGTALLSIAVALANGAIGPPTSQSDGDVAAVG